MSKKIKEKEKNKTSKSLFEDLSSLTLSFSESSKMKIEGNKIIHDESDICETCLIGPPMKNGVFRISFKEIEAGCSFGIIDKYSNNIVSGKSISESNSGIELKSDICEGMDILELIGFFLKSIDSFFFSGVVNDEFDIFGHPKNIKFYDKSHRIVESFNEYLHSGILTIELDLRSDDPKKRNAYFFFKDNYFSVFFSELPSVVQFGVFLYFYLNYSFLCLIFIHVLFFYLFITYILLVMFIQKEFLSLFCFF